MAFCYDKLKGRITEVCGTKQHFAELMGISKATMSAKINNKSEFTQPEIAKAIAILNLEKSDIPTYFFTFEVQKN